MYERMLNKQEKPTFEEMASYCGERAVPFISLNEWLSSELSTEQSIVFPYGNSYGWGIAHKRKNRLVCNVFAENNAFTIMMRLANKQWDDLYQKAGGHMKSCIENKYPCGDGAWIHFRVLDGEELEDIKLALTMK